MQIELPIDQQWIASMDEAMAMFHKISDLPGEPGRIFGETHAFFADGAIYAIRADSAGYHQALIVDSEPVFVIEPTSNLVPDDVTIQHGGQTYEVRISFAHEAEIEAPQNEATDVVAEASPAPTSVLLEMSPFDYRHPLAGSE